jgi:hypothetical protein
VPQTVVHFGALLLNDLCGLSTGPPSQLIEQFGAATLTRYQNCQRISPNHRMPCSVPSSTTTLSRPLDIHLRPSLAWTLPLGTQRRPTSSAVIKRPVVERMQVDGVILTDVKDVATTFCRELRFFGCVENFEISIELIESETISNSLKHGHPCPGLKVQ